MTDAGWKQLLEGWPWFRGEDSYPILPNSEYMPPVRLGRKPSGSWDPLPLADDDPWGWPITEYEEALTLRPGLKSIADQLLPQLAGLCRDGGTDGDGVAEYKLRENLYWPRELAAKACALEHERFVLLLPLALSLTQDDKARVRWTLFGSSEQGPSRAFWKSFYLGPDRERPAEEALDFFRTLLARAYEEPADRLADLRSAGLRFLPLPSVEGPFGMEGPLPSWTAAFVWNEGETLRGVRYLLTFRPFQTLPAAVRRKYLAGELHLLPFPGSLMFWGIPAYHRLRCQLPFAMQVPLLHFVARHLGLGAIRVPQAGWFHEDGPAARPVHNGRGPIRNTYKRTHRTARVHRYQDELVAAREHHLCHVLFSTRPHDIDLYHKPMARNVQLWDQDFQLLLDGPKADIDEIRRAAGAVADGGLFGYRFQFPAFRLGRHEVYWQRPLVAFLDAHTHRPVVLHDALRGYLTAYHEGEPDLAHPVELWPRLLQRALHAANVELFLHRKETPPHCTMNNVHKLLYAWELRDRQPLPRPFARQLLTLEKDRTLDGWLRSLPGQARRREPGRHLAEQLEKCLEPAPPSHDADLPSALTFEFTARRSFEEDYWNTIALLSSGEYVNKNNADCVLDQPTQAALCHHGRDLDRLGDYLLAYYARLVDEHGMTGQALVGELPFRWQTQYSFPWMGGWVKNQQSEAYERDLLVVIPGRDRRRAVIMADHYDTAYMYDHYEKEYGGNGARLSAPGADDNCSATVALMLGAGAFLELSKQGKLGCDVWLVHLTGEEYPAEGLGACRLCQWLVERTLKLRTLDERWHDLFSVHVQGVYVLDMIAHNLNRDRDVFQISPGVSRESLWLAYQAHLANRLWNAGAALWNRNKERRRAGRGRRSRDGRTIPPLARFPNLHGEVRLPFDPRSTLYNTDGQAFSDVGVPVVLFMENYDIERRGYHDSYDNMTQINLDDGAALAAITIESVARAATEEPPGR
jgi:hypothetical protein